MPIQKKRTPIASKDIQVCKIFTEKVTIAGLLEIHAEKDYPIRLLFAIGLAAALALSVKTLFNTAQKIIHEKAKLENDFKDDGKILFPNITVCTTAGFNATSAKEILFIPENVEEKLKARKIDRQKFIEEAVQFAGTAVLPSSYDKSHLRLIDRSLTETSKLYYQNNFFDFFRSTLQSCPKTLFDCRFDGQPIDCCQNKIVGTNDSFICYGISVSNYAFQKTIGQSKPIEFSVKVKIDWKHTRFLRSDDKIDGFLVIIGQPYTTFANKPVAVVPAWHATVKLAEIRRKYELSDCVPIFDLPKLDYHPYYDEEGKNCQADHVLKLWYKQLNWYASLVGVSGQIEEEVKDILVKHTHRRYDEIIKRIRPVNCKPICRRWRYEQIVGYSELRNQNGSAYEMDQNISWSKISVVIPSSYYEIHREGHKSSIYLQFCMASGGIIMYTGLSIVTLVQVVVYGLHSFCLLKQKKKQRKIQPIKF